MSCQVSPETPGSPKSSPRVPKTTFLASQMTTLGTKTDPNQHPVTVPRQLPSHKPANHQGGRRQGRSLKIRRPRLRGAGRAKLLCLPSLQESARESPDEVHLCRRPLPKVNLKSTKIRSKNKNLFLGPKWTQNGPQRPPKIA